MNVPTHSTPSASRKADSRILEDISPLAFLDLPLSDLSALSEAMRTISSVVKAVASQEEARRSAGEPTRAGVFLDQIDTWFDGCRDCINFVILGRAPIDQHEAAARAFDLLDYEVSMRDDLAVIMAIAAKSRAAIATLQGEQGVAP